MKNINEVTEQVMNNQAFANSNENDNTPKIDSASSKRGISDMSIMKLWSTHRQVLSRPSLHLF